MLVRESCVGGSGSVVIVVDVGSVVVSSFQLIPYTDMLYAEPGVSRCNVVAVVLLVVVLMVNRFVQSDSR